MEVQDVICNMACGAIIREREENNLWSSLMDELYLYNCVKTRWGLGYITVKHVDRHELESRPFGRYANPIRFCVSVVGHYVDLEGRMSIIFLGNGYSQALRRMSHVKSFL